MSNVDYSRSETVSFMNGFEVHRALTPLKYDKCPGEDGVSPEALKIGENSLISFIQHNSINRPTTLKIVSFKYHSLAQEGR